jgi:transposase
MAAARTEPTKLRAKIASLLQKPAWRGRSLRAVAAELGCDKNTVKTALNELRATGEFETPTRTIGRDRKVREYKLSALEPSAESAEAAVHDPYADWEAERERQVRAMPKLPHWHFWVCPHCKQDFARTGSERHGWVACGFCGDCEGAVAA